MFLHIYFHIHLFNSDQIFPMEVRIIAFCFHRNCSPNDSVCTAYHMGGEGLYSWYLKCIFFMKGNESNTLCTMINLFNTGLSNRFQSDLVIILSVCSLTRMSMIFYLVRLLQDVYFFWCSLLLCIWDWNVAYGWTSGPTTKSSFSFCLKFQV